MGGALYQWPKARWSRKIHLRLRQNPQGNQREAGKTEIDDRRTAYRQLPHDGERAFFMVSGKDRGEAVHARQICICDRESYPAAARFCFHCIPDGDSAFRFLDPKAKARTAAWRRAVCQKRPGHWRSDKSSAPGGSCGVSLSLRRIERQAAESKAAKDRAVFYVRTRPDRKSPIAVGQS